MGHSPSKHIGVPFPSHPSAGSQRTSAEADPGGRRPASAARERPTAGGRRGGGRVSMGSRPQAAALSPAGRLCLPRPQHCGMSARKGQPALPHEAGRMAFIIQGNFQDPKGVPDWGAQAVCENLCWMLVKNADFLPWLGWSIISYVKRLWLQFPVRGHT